MYKTKESVDNPDKHKRTALHLQYNADNEVSNSITREYQGDHIKQTCTRYHYDAFGRRIAKHSEIRQLVLEPNENNDNPFKQNSKTEYQHTHMLWDGDRPIQEVSDTHVYTTIYDQGSFAPIARAVWLKEGVKLVANDEPEDDYVSYDDPYAKPTPKPSEIQVFYYHNDQLGTPNELTNDKGEVAWLADYEAWGNVNKEIWREEKLKPLQIEKEYLQPIRFQGQNFDAETGLHYNRFRYYDPDMGMFISRDPIGLNGGDNVFAYAPNPTGWIDPLGLDWGMLRDYGNSPGMQAKIFEAQTQTSLSGWYMTPCQPTPPKVCSECARGKGGWKKYGGDPNMYHCGFDGYLENRLPGKNKINAPANECFYDEDGLVTETHEYKGCRGTPDDYPFYGNGDIGDYWNGVWHLTPLDDGGTSGHSEEHFNLHYEGKRESIRYFRENPSKRPKGWVDPSTPNPVYNYPYGP